MQHIATPRLRALANGDVDEASRQLRMRVLSRIAKTNLLRSLALGIAALACEECKQVAGQHDAPHAK